MGERFPVADPDVGDCPAEHLNTDRYLLRVPCVLDTGHAGPHIASDGHVIVEIWTD